jgi:hypothetical protein
MLYDMEELHYRLDSMNGQSLDKLKFLMEKLNGHIDEYDFDIFYNFFDDVNEAINEKVKQ